MSIFDPPKLNLFLHYYKIGRHIQKRDFWEFYLTYKKKTNGIIGFLIFGLILNVISIFYDKSKFNGILTVSFEFYVEIGPSNMPHDLITILIIVTL